MEENIGMRIFSAKHQEMVDQLEQIHGVRISAVACARAIFRLGNQSPDRNNGGPSVRAIKDLLDKACKVLIHEYEEELRKVEYLVFRSLVEYTENAREKDRHSRSLSTHLSAGLKYQEVKLLKSIDLSPPIIPAKDSMPPKIKDLISCCDKIVSAMKLNLSDDVPNLIKNFHEGLHMLSVCLFNKLSKFSIVGVVHVDKVQSRVSGIPVPWLEKSLESKDIKTFRSQLCLMVQGHDSIIDKLANTLFSPVFESKKNRPWAFLFLGKPGNGMGHVIKAMSEYLFLSELIQLDASEATLEKLVNCAKLKPYCLLHLKSFDKAPSSIRDSINRILTDGKLVDGDGCEVDFTKKMIIMTSNVGAQFVSYCPVLSRNLRNPNSNNPESQHICSTSCCGPERVVQEAQKFFDSMMLDRLDGIHVFHAPYSQDVAKLILREMAMSMANNQIAIYPSQCALKAIVSTAWSSTPNLHCRNGHALKGWLFENVYPAVQSYNGECNDQEFSSIYIDTLVGTNELSYRKELHGTLLENYFLKKYAISWKKVEAVYKGERKLYEHVVMLREKWSNPILCNQIDEKGDYNQVFIHMIESLKKTLYSMLDISDKSPLKQVRCRQLEQEEIQVLRSYSGYRLRGRNLAIDVIMEAIFMSTNARADPPYQPASTLMLLGFGSDTRKKIVTGLLKLLSFTRSLSVFYIDMSKHNFVTRLFKASNPPAEIEGISLILPSIIDVVEAWPYCVIFLDKVEEASASDYSHLLRILDTGMLDNGVYKVDFRKAVIVLTSNLGRKEIISEIFPCPNLETTMDDVQQEGSRFRSELLSRVHEVILANPSSPREIARVDMKNAQHLRMASDPSGYFFRHIFKKDLDPTMTETMMHQVFFESFKFYLSIKIEKSPRLILD